VEFLVALLSISQLLKNVQQWMVSICQKENKQIGSNLHILAAYKENFSLKLIVIQVSFQCTNSGAQVTNF
jgi:hypothetical protein